MLDHPALTHPTPRQRPARLRVSWLAAPPAAPHGLDLRRGGRRLATAARLGLAGAALMAAPHLRFRITPRWWPSFMSAARAAGPRAVAWTVLWAACNAAIWVASGFKRDKLA